MSQAGTARASSSSIKKPGMCSHPLLPPSPPFTDLQGELEEGGRAGGMTGPVAGDEGEGDLMDRVRQRCRNCAYEWAA